MSPYFYNGWASVFFVDYDGLLGWDSVGSTAPGVRPTINIRSDVSLTGSGTTSDPFKVVGAS